MSKFMGRKPHLFRYGKIGDRYWFCEGRARLGCGATPTAAFQDWAQRVARGRRRSVGPTAVVADDRAGLGQPPQL